MSVDQSGGLRMEIGVLYLSHAMLVLAELIVCSTRGFACILAKWFWPTEITLVIARAELFIVLCSIPPVRNKIGYETRALHPPRSPAVILVLSFTNFCGGFTDFCRHLHKLFP